MKALFEDLKGKILTKIIGKVGDDEMIFETTDNEKYALYYEHE